MSYRIFEKIVEGNKEKGMRENKRMPSQCFTYFTKRARSISKLLSARYVRLPTFSHVYLFLLHSMTQHQKDIHFVCYWPTDLVRKLNKQFNSPKSTCLIVRRCILIPCYYTFKTSVMEGHKSFFFLRRE